MRSAFSGRRRRAVVVPEGTLDCIVRSWSHEDAFGEARMSVFSLGRAYTRVMICAKTCALTEGPLFDQGNIPVSVTYEDFSREL